MTQELIIGLAEKMKKRKAAGAAVRRPRGRARRRGPTRGREAFGELKFHDLDIDDAVVATGGTIAEDSCITIAQGTTESERIGRKLIVKSIGWRFEVRLPQTSDENDTSETVRVILFLDKQTNGATATVAGILETADYQSFNNLANKSRFRTLMDRTYDLNAHAGSGRGSTDTKQFGEFIIHDAFFRKVNIPIEYDNSFTTGVITSVRTNNIGVLTISKSGLAVFNSKMRIRFSDG